MVKKINFNCTFCGFSFTLISKCRKRPWNLYKYKNFFLKTYFSLIIEYGMYLKCLQKPRCLGWFKTSQALLSAVHKTRLNSSKDNFIAKSFRLSTKRKLSILLNFLFPFVSFIGVFSILKCKTLVMKATTPWTRASHFVGGRHLPRCQIRLFPHPLNSWHDHWTFVGEWGMGDFTVQNFSHESHHTPWTRASHFVDGWHLPRCQIRLFPHPLNGWHDHWTFVGEWGMGDFTDLVCIGRIFSQTSLELKFFSPT